MTLYAYNGDTSGSITFTLAFRNALYYSQALIGCAVTAGIVAQYM